jgi:hypothetical protein
VSKWIFTVLALVLSQHELPEISGISWDILGGNGSVLLLVQLKVLINKLVDEAHVGQDGVEDLLVGEIGLETLLNIL